MPLTSSIFTLSCILLASLTAHAEMSQPEMQALFENSRSPAAQAVSSTQDCQIQSSELPATVKGWLSSASNRQALAQDIVTSAHSWSWGNYQMCATTLNGPRSPIEFSYSSCLPVLRTSEDAARILIETSLFHVGITGTAEITAAARFLNSAKHLCYPPGSPFDPSICPSQPMTQADLLSYLGPAENFKAVGQHQFYLRSRFCNKLTGCLPWAAAIPTEYYGYKSPWGWNWRSASEVEKFLRISISGSSSDYRAYADHAEVIEATEKTTKVGAFKWKSTDTKQYEVSVALMEGGIHRTCSWLRFFGSSSVSTSGAYYELEAIYYGTH